MRGNTGRMNLALSYEYHPSELLILHEMRFNNRLPLKNSEHKGLEKIYEINIRIEYETTSKRKAKVNVKPTAIQILTHTEQKYV